MTTSYDPGLLNLSDDESIQVELVCAGGTCGGTVDGADAAGNLLVTVEGGARVAFNPATGACVTDLGGELLELDVWGFDADTHAAILGATGLVCGDAQ